PAPAQPAHTPAARPQQPARPAPGPSHAPVAKPNPPPAPKPPMAKPPAPKPQPPKPAPGPGHHHAVDRTPNYRPGHFGHQLARPHSDRNFYRNWVAVRPGYRYTMSTVNQQMSALLYLNGQRNLAFQFEESAGTGYEWFVRCDPTYCAVSVTHQQTRSFFGLVGGPQYADINIQAIYPGDTVVELIYARRWEWERGVAPLKVVQVYLQIR
ncbi:MAG: hypothetical protein J6334_13585, partial [Kiritimatiellae bacterium]|nr:hypothetical protein [Kiritimatiellia bacterium]